MADASTIAAAIDSLCFPLMGNHPWYEEGARNLFRIDAVARAATDTIVTGGNRPLFLEAWDVVHDRLFESPVLGACPTLTVLLRRMIATICVVLEYASGFSGPVASHLPHLLRLVT